jgi:hypothetical protein
MNAILEILSRGVEQLLGRASGPLHFRLVMMPTVVTILAVRAGLRDAREGQPAFLWAILTNSADRRQLLRSARKDIGRVFVIALVLDTVYQLIALRAFYVVQALVVAVVCAIVPYVLFRGPVTRLARRLYRRHARPADIPATNPTEKAEGRPEVLQQEPRP